MRADPTRTVRPDLGRLMADIDHLATFRDPSEPGATRRVLTPEYRAGREWIAARMGDAGLEPSLDHAGNLIGRRRGAAPAIVTGSHTDTVRGGGRLDGVLGVLGAIEAVRSLDEAGIELVHELRVVDFLGEEPNDWGISCIGSRALVGELGSRELECRAPDGTTLADALMSFGIDPGSLGAARWAEGDLRAFVELHIEQGPRLEDAGVTIGVVTGIVGVARFLVEFRGRRDHAGTMPMPGRHDAAAAAAELVLAVERIASDGHGVGTCGRVEVGPGALNVVPDHARVGVELRSIDDAWLTASRAEVERLASDAGARRGVGVDVTDLSSEPATEMSPSVQDLIRGVADRLELSAMSLPSGAEHDTRRMARLGPVGMIFTPSRAGRSHCPEEDTDPEDLRSGVMALAVSLADLDRTPDDALDR